VADRRLLVLLDHAHSAAQVQPLLAAAPGVLTVVVSRGPLPGLDAVPVLVGPLPDKHAKALLAAVLPAPALDAAAGLLPDVLAQCGGSPYPLRAAAPRLLQPGPAGRPEGPDAGAVPAGDPVTAAAERAYRTLDPVPARAYRLMALRPWPAFGVEVAAHTLRLAPEETTEALDALVAAQLLQAPGHRRYRYRPEVRAHAELTAAGGGRHRRVLGCGRPERRLVPHVRGTGPQVRPARRLDGRRALRGAARGPLRERGPRARGARRGARQPRPSGVRRR
jgi:hypothetical protein